MILTFKAYCCRDMPQSVSRRHFTLEAWVLSQASKISGSWSGPGTAYSPRTSVYPCRY